MTTPNTTYHLETADGHSYCVTLQTLPDMIHRVEQHINARVFLSARLCVLDPDGNRQPLFHFVAGFWKVHRLSHTEYCRWLAAPHRRVWRAISNLFSR